VFETVAFGIDVSLRYSRKRLHSAYTLQLESLIGVYASRFELVVSFVYYIAPLNVASDVLFHYCKPSLCYTSALCQDLCISGVHNLRL
jgi:hypothetical protein